MFKIPKITHLPRPVLPIRVSHTRLLFVNLTWQCLWQFTDHIFLT